MTELTNPTSNDLANPDQIIQEAQDYLTFQGDGNTRMILDLNHLLINHSIQEVSDFLKHYLREKQKSLRNMIQINKTHPKVDKLVSSMFRLYMAIQILNNGKEVNPVEQSQQGAEGSCRIQKRNSSGHCDSRERQNTDHDGKNRNPRQRLQRVL